MSWFGNLNLRTKFNLIMSLLLICLFLAAAFLTYRKQQHLILRIAEDNARNIARQIIETRDYMSGAVRDEAEKNYDLVPQVVATRVAKRSLRAVRTMSGRYHSVTATRIIALTITKPPAWRILADRSRTRASVWRQSKASGPSATCNRW